MFYKMTENYVDIRLLCIYITLIVNVYKIKDLIKRMKQQYLYYAYVNKIL